MRRGTSVGFKLARVALAYVLALQALLGAFAGSAAAADTRSFDPSLSLCRTIAGGEPQQSGDHPASHCAVMCVSGACAAGDPPAAAGAAIEFPQLRATSISVLAADDHRGSSALRPGLSARGPPSIG